MTKAEQIKARAVKMIRSRTTAQLVALFEETEIRNDEHIYTVRGWIMDELEARNPEAFEAWLEDYESSPRKFF